QAVLPALTLSLAQSPGNAVLAQSIGAIGLTVAVVPWSLVSARVSRAVLLRAAVAASAALALLVPFAPTFELLVAARFAQGAAIAGIPALALAHLSELVEAPRAIAI